MIVRSPTVRVGWVRMSVMSAAAMFGVLGSTPALGQSVPVASTPEKAKGTVAVTASPAGSVAGSAVPGAGTTAWPLPAGQLHQKLGEAKTGPNPKQVAFTPNGTELWVPLLGSTGVDVFRVPDMERVARVPLGTDGGVEVTFTKDSKRAYVSQMQTASVYEIDVATKKVLRVLKTGGNWTKVLELSPDESTLYAANWVSDTISVIDLRTGVATMQIATVDTPRGLVVSPDGGSLYVAGFENGEIVKLDVTAAKRRASTTLLDSLWSAARTTSRNALRSAQMVGSTSNETSSTTKTTTTRKATVDSNAKPFNTVLYRTGGAMRHLVLDAQRNLLYADDMGRDEAYVLDLATGKVRTLAKTDSHPNTIDLSPDGRFLYVSNRGQNSPAGYNQFGPDFGSVLIFDTETGKTLDAIVGGNQTTGLDVSPDGRYLAFTDFQDARVQLYAIPPATALAASDGARVKTYRAELLRKKN